MADIIEHINSRLTFELANIIFSFLGRSKSAKLIADANEQFETSDLFLYKMRDEKYYLSQHVFIKNWNLVNGWNIKLQYFKSKPTLTFDIENVISCVENLSCSNCCVCIHLDNYVNYDGKCEWCYGKQLGYEDEEYEPNYIEEVDEDEFWEDE